MADNLPAVPPMGGSDGKPDRPARALTRVSRWLGTQSTNLDPERRAAALHVMSRWDVHTPWFSMAKVLRTLQREESEHLTGFRMLCDDYVRAFDDDGAKLEIGSAGPFTPIEIERCYKCTKDAIPGSNACGKHGGQYLTAQDAARISAHTSAKIIAATDIAVRTLVEIMDEGKSEMVRVQAATAILDRAGIGPSSTLRVDVSREGDDAAKQLHARLDGMKESLEKAQQIEFVARAVHEEEPVDAEVVEEDPNGSPGPTQ